MTTLQKTIFLKADPATVWDYLTDPDKLAIWFHKPKKPLEIGSYEMFGAESGDRLMWGEVTTYDPHQALTYTFTIAPMGDATSTVSWVLTKVAGGTRLELRHDGLPDGEEAYGLTLALDKGWDDHLGRMRADAHADT
jgi:uncharacterized protein YndB with AHSA1/START domain